MVQNKYKDKYVYLKVFFIRLLFSLIHVVSKVERNRYSKSDRVYAVFIK